MPTLQLDNRDEDSNLSSSKASSGLTLLKIAMVIMALATISPPEDLSATSQSTDSILPPKVISQLKLLARATGAILISTVLLGRSYRENIWRHLCWCLPLLLFSGWIFASTLWSPLRSTTLNQAGSISILFLLTYGLTVVCRTREDTVSVLQTLSKLLILISMGLILLRLVAPNYGALTRDSGGLFHSTNSSATASLGILISLLTHYVSRTNGRKGHPNQWTILLLAFAVHAVALLLAGNRTTLFLTTALTATILLLFSRREKVAVAISAIGVAGLVYLLIDPTARAVEKMGTKVTAGLAQGQTGKQLRSISGRSEMWEEIWISYQQSPVRGHGYFVTSRTGKIHVWGEWGNWTAHNVYLQLLVTSGAIGFILFGSHVAMYLFAVFSAAIRKDAFCNRIAVLAIFFAIWFAGWGMLNSSIFGPIQPEAIIFFTISGLLFANAKRPEGLETGQ